MEPFTNSGAPSRGSLKKMPRAKILSSLISGVFGF
jgi:hypothetical protein